MVPQRTIKREAKISGISLHLGSICHLTFKPSPPNSGLIFMRTDLPGTPRISANIANTIGGVVRRTSVGTQEVMMHTIEHVLAAMAGLQIDNVIIEADAPEPPAADGSALPFVEILKDAGILEQDTPRREIKITDTISVKNGDKELLIAPDDNCKITYAFKADGSIPLTQLVSLEFNEEIFIKGIAPARTFCFRHEIAALKAQDLGKGGSSDNVIVIDEEGQPDHKLRFEDEMARHKILDLIGDLYLLGGVPKGHLIGIRSGHELNAKLIQKIAELEQRDRRMNNIPTMEPLDVNEIKRILPHRYPFLMLDRVIELEKDKRAVGIKNVTVNEQFFQGHFPQQPIMPGMLQVEALAQLAGVLLFNDQKDSGTLAYFRTVEKVKFRKPVVPGDQLRLEVLVIRKKGKLAKFSGQALVNGEITTEAEFTIAL
jgi:UDP-3-O-[3-hydroxymyristoyl] N-acetylglucosamine deacetylase/3-hydroxyacyl-[acyl-carrier-protein] dehydratase